MRLNFDSTCNLHCIFCRKDITKSDKYDLEKVRALIDKLETFLPVLDKNNWHISLNGAGEVFTSKYFLSFIKKITQNYKNIKFQIITNGLLCTKEMLEELGIIDRLVGIEVSVHAFKEKTYNRLVRGGNFKKLRENLEYISFLKKTGKQKLFYMNFVINAYNYHEMPEFTKWCIELGATPNFLPLIKTIHLSQTIFDKLNVVSMSHNKYNDFVKIMHELSKYKDEILIPEHYYHLQLNKQSFMERFTGKFFKSN